MAAKVANAVADDANWRAALKTEVNAAKNFQQEWGFLAQPNVPDVEVKGTGTFKYFEKGGFTMIQRAVPLRGEAADRARKQMLEHEALMSTFAAGGGSARPSTALESTFFSHSHRLDHIRSTNMAYDTTYQKYGSRYTLEQFGVSQHGLQHVLTEKPPK